MALVRPRGADYAVSIGQNIKRLRERLRLNQTQFGKKIGVGQGAVSQWESDLTTPTPENVTQMCTIYGVDEADIRPNANGATLPKKVPLKGRVGKGGAIEMTQGAIRQVPAPPDSSSKEVEAYLVDDEANDPAYRLRDIIYILSQFDGEIGFHLGKDCVAELDTGERVLARLQRGTAAGIYTLLAYRDGVLYEDRKLVGVSRILWVKRADD